MLSGKQPGNENYRVPGSWPGTRVTDPGTRSEHYSLLFWVSEQAKNYAIFRPFL